MVDIGCADGVGCEVEGAVGLCRPVGYGGWMMVDCKV